MSIYYIDIVPITHFNFVFLFLNIIEFCSELAWNLREMIQSNSSDAENCFFILFFLLKIKDSLQKWRETAWLV